MLLSFDVFLLCVPAVLFAGFSKGGFGSGAAFASSSILAVVLDPVQAVGLMLPLLMLMDVASLPSYWRKWDWQASRALLIGSVPGILLGVVFFRSANPDLFRLMIGLIAVLFVAWQLLRAQGWFAPSDKKPGQHVGGFWGVVMGFTSFISHAGGPPAAIYLLGQGLSKTTFQATTVLVFWAVNLMKSGFYVGMGVFTRETLLLDLALVPFAIVGVWLGVKAHHRISQRMFFGVTYTALVLTGSKLIWDALT